MRKSIKQEIKEVHSSDEQSESQEEDRAPVRANQRRKNDETVIKPEAVDDTSFKSPSHLPANDLEDSPVAQFTHVQAEVAKKPALKDKSNLKASNSESKNVSVYFGGKAPWREEPQLQVPVTEIREGDRDAFLGPESDSSQDEQQMEVQDELGLNQNENFDMVFKMQDHMHGFKRNEIARLTNYKSKKVPVPYMKER